MEYIIECNYCGEEFTSKRSNAKFCSGNCRTKNHYSNKQEKEEIEILDSAIAAEQHSRIFSLKAQLQEEQTTANYYNSVGAGINRYKSKTVKRIDTLEFEIKTKNFQIDEAENLRKRLAQKNISIKERMKANDVFSSDESNDTVSKNKAYTENIGLYIKQLDNIIEEDKLLEKISKLKFDLIKIEHELGKRKSDLETVLEDEKSLTKKRETTLSNIKKLKLEIIAPPEIKKTVVPSSIKQSPIHKIIATNRTNNTNEIGAGDLQNMNFETFQLSTELGRFLGELDRNRTCFALTGDSGAGKTYFSFELANLFISSLNINAKYFSLEEGIGKLTQEKVAQYNLGNELSIVAKGDLKDVKKAAKSYPLIIVDSFNKLNAKAVDFEALRTDFPKTLFILIFQKTASGTMRGGSSIKYDSSATINVTKRDGERIAIMEKGRYGTIGWEYSIDEGRVVEEY